MAYYDININSGGSAINVTNASSTFANGSGWSCQIGNSGYYTIATKYDVNGSVIYGFNFANVVPTLSNNDDSTADLYIYNPALSVTGNTSIYYRTGSASSSASDYSSSGLTHSSNTYYTLPSASMSTYYSIKLYSSTYGYSGSSSVVRPCGGSANASSCCSSSSLACSCTSASACSSSSAYSSGCCASSAYSCSCTSASACSSSSAYSSGCCASSAYSCSCTSVKTTCVDGLTKILMSNMSYKYIKDIRQGESIKTIKNSKLEDSIILGKYVSYKGDEIFKLCFDDNSYLFITDRHPILTDSCYCTISEFYPYTKLKIGDKVVATNNLFKTITNIIKYSNSVPVYNLLNNNDNFIANDIVIACEDPNTLYEIQPNGDRLKCTVATCSGSQGLN